MRDISEYSAKLGKLLQSGNVEETLSEIKKALAVGLEPLTIIDEALVPAIRRAGDMFERGELFLPHLMRSAESMKKSMALLSANITHSEQDAKDVKNIILGTVEGDIHDIGKNIVALLLSASGYSVVDLGASVPISRFIEEIERISCHPIIVGMSSLLTTTMIQQKQLIDTLIAKGLREKVKIMVGGACVSQEWALEIGADGYGLNAQAAVNLTNDFFSNT